MKLHLASTVLLAIVITACDRSSESRMQQPIASQGAYVRIDAGDGRRIATDAHGNEVLDAGDGRQVIVGAAAPPPVAPRPPVQRPVAVGTEPFQAPREVPSPAAHPPQKTRQGAYVYLDAGDGRRIVTDARGNIVLDAGDGRQMRVEEAE